MGNQDYKKSIRTLFDNASPLYGKEGCAYFDYFAKTLVDLAHPLKNSSILDIATGRGAILFRAAEKTGREGNIVGIDISSQMIQETQKELKTAAFQNIKLLTMDAEKLEFADESFDMVFIGFGLFFMPDAQLVLEECYRVLKKGGTLALSLWGERDPIHSLLRDLIAPYGVYTKIVIHNFDDPASVINLLNNAKFKECKVSPDVLDYVYPSIDAWWESLWGHGTRGLLEQLSSTQQKELFSTLKEKLSPKLQKDGLHYLLKAYYVLAKK